MFPERMSLAGAKVIAQPSEGPGAGDMGTLANVPGGPMRTAYVVGLVALLLQLPSAIAAQDCSYTSCSLRVESGRLIRGRAEVVGRTTLTGMPRLAPLVAADDSAQAYARAFDHAYPRSRWLAVATGVLGGLVLGIALDRVDAPERGFVLGLGGASAALGGASWYFDRRASRSMARALWWHNRRLADPAGR